MYSTAQTTENDSSCNVFAFESKKNSSCELPNSNLVIQFTERKLSNKIYNAQQHKRTMINFRNIDVGDALSRFLLLLLLLLEGLSSAEGKCIFSALSVCLLHMSLSSSIVCNFDYQIIILITYFLFV